MMVQVKHSILLLVLQLGLFAAATTARGAEMDINTLLMRSTVKISDQKSVGTVFILGRPLSSDQSKATYVLVTAAHVLKNMQGEQATLYLRKKEGDGFAKLEYQVPIRNGKEPLWKEHSDVDVAAMDVDLPKEADVPLLATSLLVTDDQLKEFEIHPGDTLFCLGFPYGLEANEAGFPILRSGNIASFPLTPTKKVQSFLFDFDVFGGNSGGPVYFSETNRRYGDSMRLGSTIRFLAGVVSRQVIFSEKVRSVDETRQVQHSLSLAVVIHASFILETIALLPPLPTAP